MPLSADEFYLSNPPSTLQQGEIIAGVPLLLLPPLDHLVVVRSSHHRLRLEHLEPGAVELVRDTALSDSFENGYEYVVVAATESWAMIMTATCDLEGQDVWAVWPFYPVEGSDLDEGKLNSGRYANLDRVPNNKYFPPAYLDLTDFRPIRREQAPLRDRIASITREAQHEVMEKFFSSVGRPWGYAANETVEPIGQYETGKYRCARCNLYDVIVPEIPLHEGSPFPECDNCKKIRKSAQWYPVTKHRKS